MTENQQRIIDSLVAEFNSRNETKKKSSFRLINVDEFDEINNLHKELLEDSRRSKQLWDDQRKEFIEDLIDQLRDDLDGRLIVNRGDVATENPNYSTSIFIYRRGTEKHFMLEKAFRFEVCLIYKREKNATTNQYYDDYTNLCIKRYVSPNHETTYRNEEELFKCENTKARIKGLLNDQTMEQQSTCLSQLVSQLISEHFKSQEILSTMRMICTKT